jgi:hypothetical protein
MLSEIFMLRLEAILRASNALAPGSSDTRFVPIKPSVSPAITMTNEIISPFRPRSEPT